MPDHSEKRHWSCARDEVLSDFWFFCIPQIAGWYRIKHLSQNIEKLKGNFFSDKKSHSAKKTERWDPLRFFNIHSDAKQQKKIERRTL